MTSNSPNTLATTLTWRAFVVLSLAAYARAQYYDPYYGDNRNTPGRVIAGIVVAISIAILFLVLFALMFRRRRRGLTVLPSYAGGNFIASHNHTGQTHNQNQGPYSSYPMSNQQAWGGYQAPPGPPPQGDNAPPPPYPGKPKPYDGEANSGYGYPTTPGQEAPKPGGFVVPQPQTPTSPAPAHVNTHANSPWFRSS